MIISIENIQAGINHRCITMKQITPVAASFVKTGPPDIYQWGFMFFIVFQLENTVGCTIIIDCNKI